MGAIRNIVVRIGADVGAFRQAMQSASNSMTTFGSKMQNIGAGMSLAISAPLLLIGKNMLSMAMDAVESENLFEVAFGSMSKEARAFSENLRESLGLNAYDIRKNSATLNAMIKSMGLTEQAAYKMSTGLIQLSYDMASFYNLKPEEAFNKLKSGITGEAEPLKALGILVNETTIKTWALTNGLAKQGQEMTEQQKVIARYGSILEQTKLAQGDLARTMDSPTNKIRILKDMFNELQIKMGTQLIPILDKVIEMTKPLVSGFSELSPTVQKIIAVIGVLAVALPPLITAIGTVATGLSVIIGVIGTLGAEIIMPIVAIAALVAALIYFYNTNEKVKDFVNNAWDLIVKTFQRAVNFMIGIWNNYGIPMLESIIEMWDVVIAFVTPIFEAFVENFKIMYNEFVPIVGDLNELFSAVGDMIMELYEGAKPVLQALGGVLWVLFGVFLSVFGGIVRAISPYIKAIINQINSMVKVVEAASALVRLDFGKAKDAMSGAIKNQVESFDNIANSVTGFIKGSQSTADSYVKGTMAAMDAYDKAMVKVKAIWAGKGENKLSTLKLGNVDFIGSGGKKPEANKVDTSKLNNSYNTDIVKDMGKELGAMGETGQKAIDKLTDKIKSFGQAVKQQASSFSNFVGLFDKVSSDQASGDRLLARLKGQLKVMELWKKSIEKLQNALGGTSPLFQQLLNQGPAAAFQVAALARLSPEKLQEYSSVYQNKEQIATQMAVPSVLGQYAQERAMNQVVINITGNKIDEEIDIDWIANSIVSKLRLSGVLP